MLKGFRKNDHDNHLEAVTYQKKTILSEKNQKQLRQTRIWEITCAGKVEGIHQSPNKTSKVEYDLSSKIATS